MTAALLGEPEPEHFKLTFAERPGIRDGALVWIIRNDGPGKASQYVEEVNFVDLDSGTEVCRVQLTPHEDVEPQQTQESLPITHEQLGQDLQEGKRYRAEVTTHLGGDGDQASLEVSVQSGALVAE